MYDTVKVSMPICGVANFETLSILKQLADLKGWKGSSSIPFNKNYESHSKFSRLIYGSDELIYTHQVIGGMRQTFVRGIYQPEKSSLEENHRLRARYSLIE